MISPWKTYLLDWSCCLGEKLSRLWSTLLTRARMSLYASCNMRGLTHAATPTTERNKGGTQVAGSYEEWIVHWKSNTESPFMTLADSSYHVIPLSGRIYRDQKFVLFQPVFASQVVPKLGSGIMARWKNQLNQGLYPMTYVEGMLKRKAIGHLPSWTPYYSVSQTYFAFERLSLVYSTWVLASGSHEAFEIRQSIRI